MDKPITAGVALSIIALFVGATLTRTLAQELPTVPSGFTITQIATVTGARELAVASNGDLLVGTAGSDIYIVQHADAQPAAPKVFAHVDDSPAAGVAITANTLYIGSQFNIWRVPYHVGDLRAAAPSQKIAAVRTSGVSRDHVTTSVAFTSAKLYASVGSSCNNCWPDLDDTRATIQEMNPDGSHRSVKAVHIRNAIALAVNPATGTLWAGVAGQDELAHGHPYELFDAVSLQTGVADYGWPDCYENRKSANRAHDCSHVVVSRVVFPAYETPIGAAFYPTNAKGRFAFPRMYWGGAFVGLHGSWHTPLVPPRVVFVPMRGDTPARAVDWNNPDAQWTEFLGGFQRESGERVARPTGVAVGPQGDLFVADDYHGAIYRIRPSH